MMFKPGDVVICIKSGYRFEIGKLYTIEGDESKNEAYVYSHPNDLNYGPGTPNFTKSTLVKRIFNVYTLGKN